MNILPNFVPPDLKHVSFVQHSLELIRVCEDLCWNHDESMSKTESIECPSALLVQSRLSEKVWRAATECFCFVRNMEDKLADRKSPYERRFVFINLGQKMRPKIILRYALNSGRGRTGDLIIAEWHDIENNVASEVHVKRLKSKEVGIKNLQGCFYFIVQMVP